ncbi:MAG: putative transcriptional regulator [Paenibacillaceae bacterium]|nr:putative transcriptional regulator [Paenibacillaceae bacterium]
MPKSFSEHEKQNIRGSLIDSCRSSWRNYGYKRTNIDELCQKAGISKGAFYIFFPSKEQLFYETLLVVQQSLYILMEEILSKEPGKPGLAKALKAVYAEYDKSPFLYDTASADFTGFINKLAPEEREAIGFDSLSGAKKLLSKSYLTLRIPEEMALSVLASLLNIAANKEKLLYDHFRVFEFMLDNVMDEIFE